MYEEFESLQQVHARLAKRFFGNFVVNEQSCRTTKFSTKNKKYALQSEEPPEDIKPKVKNNCKEVKTIGEVNSCVGGAKWHRVIAKPTGTYIVLWGTHEM